MNEFGLDAGIIWLTFFILSVFVGIEVISKVSTAPHTPLMSGTNAIHGIILVGAMLVTGHSDSVGVDSIVGTIAYYSRGGQPGRRLRRHRPDAADVQPQEAHQAGRAEG